MQDNEIIVMLGSEIKFNKGKLEGYLVRFGDAKQTDLENDYFTANTDFGREIDEKTSLNLYYHHGLDPVIGKRTIGKGYISRTPEGIWYEGQIQMRDEYDKMIAKLLEEGKLGFSSGAASHMVERKMVGNAFEITRWALAEASITPRPAEPRAWASAKSLAELKMETKPYYDEEGRWHPKRRDEKNGEEEMDDEELVLTEDINEAVFGNFNEELVSASINKLYERMLSGIYSVMESGGSIEQINSLLDGFHQRALGIINKISFSDGEMEMLKSIFAPSKPTDIRNCEKRLRDAFGLSRKEAVKLASTVWAGLCDKDEPAAEIEIETKTEAVDKDKVNRLLAKVMLDLI